MIEFRLGWLDLRTTILNRRAVLNPVTESQHFPVRYPQSAFRQLACLPALLLLALTLLMIGCAKEIVPVGDGPPTPGGGGPTPTPTPSPTPTPTPPPAVAAITFTSMRALDGSDFSPAGQPMNIWTVNADGSGLTAITKLANVTSPASILINQAATWSPDGKRIAFASDRALDGSDNSDTNGVFNIWVMNADGTNPKPLTTLTANTVLSVNPAWSPDSTKIAYTSNRAQDGSDALDMLAHRNIWVVNADGTGNKLLTNEDAGADGDRPVWSPDGAMIAFMSTRPVAASTNGADNVWVMKADGSGQTAMSTYTASGVGSHGYAWSPDSVHLVYGLSGDLSLDKAATENIFVVNPHIASPFGRTALTQFTHPTSLDPAFSPDGSKIIFMSNRALAGGDALEGSGVVNVWVMNADGSVPAPLTQFHVFGLNTEAFQGGEYQLSKDGTQIIFASLRALDGSEALNPGAQNIWVMNADGSGQKPVTKTTTGQTDGFFPQWHP